MMDFANPAGPRERRILVAAAGLLVSLFLCGRIGLLLTSYDANKNWEEPVFLFSATELARDGLTHIFDHQDDLNHGGSVLLLLLAVPWVSLVGTSLLALKGVAVLWSALTVGALIVVAWRYCSPTVGLLLGIFYTALSPTLARINITLVGSHPEALLPCTVALACHFEAVRRRTRGLPSNGWVAGALGCACGVAMWVAYISAMFVAPLLLIQLMLIRKWQDRAALCIGLLAGAAPWIWQNVWL